MIYLDQIVVTYVFYHCPATGMNKVHEASQRIVLAGGAHLVKKIIFLEPCNAFGSNLNTFYYYYSILFFFCLFFILFFSLSN